MHSASIHGTGRNVYKPIYFAATKTQQRDTHGLTAVERAIRESYGPKGWWQRIKSISSVLRELCQLAGGRELRYDSPEIQAGVEAVRANMQEIREIVARDLLPDPPDQFQNLDWLIEALQKRSRIRSQQELENQIFETLFYAVEGVRIMVGRLLAPDQKETNLPKGLNQLEMHPGGWLKATDNPALTTKLTEHILASIRQLTEINHQETLENLASWVHQAVYRKLNLLADVTAKRSENGHDIVVLTRKPETQSLATFA